MACFSWVDELRRSACTGECGRNFVADVATLTHAANNDSALDGREKIDCFGKAVVNAVLQLLNGLSLNSDGASGRLYGRSWWMMV
jgi:hypothetical protein